MNIPSTGRPNGKDVAQYDEQILSEIWLAGMALGKMLKSRRYNFVKYLGRLSQTAIIKLGP